MGGTGGGEMGGTGGGIRLTRFVSSAIGLSRVPTERSHGDGGATLPEGLIPDMQGLRETSAADLQ